MDQIQAATVAIKIYLKITPAHIGVDFAGEPQRIYSILWFSGFTGIQNYCCIRPVIMKTGVLRG